MKNLTIKKLEQKYDVLILKATDNLESLQHAENWHGGIVPKRCYGISLPYLNGRYIAKNSFTSLQEIVDYLEN